VVAGSRPPRVRAVTAWSRARVVEGATHVSVLYDPDDAKITSAAIVGVVEAARDDRPLARQVR
jgi:hypothetical protein